MKNRQMRDNYSDFKILQSKKSWLSGSDDNDNENTLVHILICSFEGLTFHYFMTLGKSLAHATNMYYTITYMAAPGKYRRYLPIAEHMIRFIISTYLKHTYTAIDNKLLLKHWFGSFLIVRFLITYR